MTPDSCWPVHPDSQHDIPTPSKCQHDPVTTPSDAEEDWESGGTQSPGSITISEAYPITEEQLSGEVHAIYAGVEMVEKKCIELYEQYGKSQNQFSSGQWQALVALSQTLLQEHHDFYIASQHPSANQEVHQVAEKLSMPKRLWQHGIFYLLDMMRRRLPDSREHMVAFIHLAYSMLTLLLESVPKFEEMWTECLGSLARFQMAMEGVDVHEREMWAGIARYWYNRAAAKQPKLGRIQFQLALLSQGDFLRQLFYYTGALMSNCPFPAARAAIVGLSNTASRGSRLNQQTFVTGFVGTQAAFLTRGTSDQLTFLCGCLLSVIDKSFARMGAAFKLPGVFVMSCNFAAMFEYRHTDGILNKELKKASVSCKSFDQVSQSAWERWANNPRSDTPEAELATEDSPRTANLIFSSYFTFQMLSIILARVADANVLPAVHVSLAFIWHLVLIGNSIKHVEAAIPWRAITTFLNARLLTDTSVRVADCAKFPTVEGRRHLPEDFYMAGKVWSQVYYPSGFFGELCEDDERWIEVPSSNVLRSHRCLCFGGRIATVRADASVELY